MWKTQKGPIQALTLGGKDKCPTQLHRATEELCAHRPASGPSGSPRLEGGGLPLPSTHGLHPLPSSSAARWAARQETGVASMRFSNWGQGRNLNCGQLCLLKILISWCSYLKIWEIDGETMEIVTEFILGGSKITADGNCSHEIKRHLLLGGRVMANLGSILKSRDMTLPTKVRLVKAMVFPVVMYGCESWTVKKAEHRRIDAFELWCWRRLLRVPWTARRSNQSILKEISPGCSLEGLI